MAKAIPSPPAGTPLQLDFSLSKSTHCPKCGGRYFIQVVEVRYFSSLSNPTGREVLAPREKLMCVSCRSVCDLANLECAGGKKHDKRSEI